MHRAPKERHLTLTEVNRRFYLLARERLITQNRREPV